jgi:hypothetical protein
MDVCATITVKDSRRRRRAPRTAFMQGYGKAVNDESPTLGDAMRVELLEAENAHLRTLPRAKVNPVHGGSW